MKRKHIIYVIGLLVITLLFSLTTVLAAPKANEAIDVLGKVTPATGLDKGNLPELIGQLIKGALSLAGLAFFALMVYAGFIWMTAHGEEDKVTKARGTVKATVIGLAVVIAAYAVTTLVSERLLQGKPGEGGIEEGPAGCCIDWVAATSDVRDGIPSSAILSREQCKNRGETADQYGDRLAGPEGEGYWEFYSDVTDAGECGRKASAKVRVDFSNLRVIP